MSDGQSIPGQVVKGTGFCIKPLKTREGFYRHFLFPDVILYLNTNVTIEDDPDGVKRGNSFSLNDRNGV